MEYLRELNFWSMLLRMILAVLAGGLLGLDRERKGHPAGLRTYMIVCLGSAMTMLLSQYLYMMLETRWLAVSTAVGVKTDVSRFGAQVINGIGFLGAGTILVTQQQQVKGLTTAASLWASACMGIAIGAGFYECFLSAFVLILLSLGVFPKLESFFKTNSRNMQLFVQLDDTSSISILISKLKEIGISLDYVDFDWSDGLNDPVVHVDIILPKGLKHVEVIKTIAQLSQVNSVQEA